MRSWRNPPSCSWEGRRRRCCKGRGALQDIDQRPVAAPHVKFLRQVRRVKDIGPAIEEAFATAHEGVQGPAFVELPVDLLYAESIVREWHGEASGKGRSIADAVLRYYINRHLQRLFGESQTASAPQARTVHAPAVRSSSVRATAAALSRASRPLTIIGSQTLASGTNPVLVAAAIERLGIPVYLSGMARGLLGRDDALQIRHQRRLALKEADCVILAGVPCDFRLDYGREVFAAPPR